MIFTLDNPTKNIQIICSIEQQYEPSIYYTREEIQQGTDADLHNYPGCLLTFQNGEQMKVLYYEANQIKYFFQGQWIDFEQIDEQIKPLIQSVESQKKVDMIKFQLIDFNANQKYTGYLLSDDIKMKTDNIFKMEELFNEISKLQNTNIENNKILQTLQSPQGQIYEIIITLVVQKMQTEFTYQLNCKLNLSNNKQDQQLIYQLKTERKIKQLENQINEMYKFQQIESQNLLMKLKESDLRTSQLEQQLKQHINKPQPNCVSLSSLQQGDKGYLKTNVLQQGFHEFVAVLSDKLDNEIEFEIGILADGDFEELKTKAKAFYFEFPAGKFRRGEDPSDQIITYSFQKNTKMGIKVNTNEHWATVTLNGYDFAPISLPDGLENFAFILKIITEGKQLDDYLNELEQ